MLKYRSRIAVGLFVVMAIVAVSLSATSPTLSWRPVMNPQYAVRGQAKTFDVTFSTLANLTDAEVRLSPDLQPFVTVSPTNLGSVPSGTIKTLTLTMTPAASAELGTVTGTLQIVRNKKPQTTYGQPLSLSITIDPFPLPPDPGEAGKETIAGIDSDGDGIRDDLQRNIAHTYPDAPNTRGALQQYAMPLQEALLQAGSKSAALQNRERIHKATDCLLALRGFEVYGEIEDSLRAEALNTKERSIAYALYDGQLAGHVFSLRGLGVLPADVCEFPIAGGAL